MKTKFYFGRKNRRTNYRLYRKVEDKWQLADIPRGVFRGWNLCNQIPKDMKPIRPEEAQEYLFLHAL